MPLQNRVDPFGELFAGAARGLFMGNRGGRFHGDDRTLGRRRWASRQWICCRLEFKNRHREIWGGGYTELFFLDEPTALAAGHRPCFECRRADARVFATCWQRAFGLAAAPRAAMMDDVLHAQRLEDRRKRTHRSIIDDLPDGAFVVHGADACVLHGGMLWHWTPDGYEPHGRAPRGVEVDVLTPPAIVAVLAAGYRPRWHPSAGTAA
jgi:hypothetical protein